MPQQINLFHPTLLAPRQHLQAAALAQALGLWTLALVALAAWTSWRTQLVQADFTAAQQRQAVERQMLAAAQAARQAAGGSPAALAEELARVQARLAERRHLLALLEGNDSSRSPLPLLGELAQALPAPVWLSEIRWTPGQVELAGQTLEPEALQAWIRQRGAPSTLRVEQQQPGGGTGAARSSQAGWSFRLRQGPGSAGTQAAGQASASAPSTSASANAGAMAPTATALAAPPAPQKGPP